MHQKRSREFLSNCIWSPIIDFRGQISIDYDTMENLDLALSLKKMEGYTKMDSRTRIKVTVNCPYFNFQQYPFDEQVCSLLLKPMVTGHFSLAGSINLSKTYNIKKANLQYTIEMENVSSRSPEDYKYVQKKSVIGVTFYLKRNIYLYLR